jgi:Mn-dependent DtxR family transcriptional regulator
MQAGWIEPIGQGQFRFTSAGRGQSLEIVRGHRLWEAFLTAYPEQATSTANLASLSIDDVVPAKVVEQLTSELRQAGRWPEAAV